MGVKDALERVNVPSYVIDAQGVIRWVNPAGERIVGDVRGRRFTSVVAPEETSRAQKMFARKIVGNESVTDAGVVVVRRDAEEPHVSRETVRNHVRHMFRVVGVHSRLEMVAAARGNLAIG